MAQGEVVKRDFKLRVLDGDGVRVSDKVDGTEDGGVVVSVFVRGLGLDDTLWLL